MSAAAVREAFRAQLSGLLGADGFTYVESVNQAEATKDLPARWFTIDFFPGDDARVTLGLPALFRESGRITVLVFTPQQQLDTVAVDAAEVIRAAMANWFDPTGMIRVLAAQPPTDLDSGDFRGSFYGITVDLLYQYDRFQ